MSVVNVEHSIYGIGRGLWIGSSTVVIPGNRAKGSVGEGEPGKKAKETLRSLRPHELVRTSLRNQKVRHNISSVQSRTDG